MLHKHDQYAVDGWSAEDHPLSVLSGRTNDEVRADPDRLWRSDRPAAQAAVVLKPDRVDVACKDEMGALDALGSAGSWSVFGRKLRVTNLDKVLFPARSGEDPVTKRDFLRYSAQIAPTVLPYLTGRALNMHRYPGGADTKGFWHKELPSHAPEWLPRWNNPAADAGESAHLPGRRRTGCARLGGKLWCPGMARLDVIGRATRAANLCVDRSRSWRSHQLGRPPRPGTATPHRTRPPWCSSPRQGHGPTWDTDLDPDRTWAILRRDPGLGRTAV